MDPFNEKNLISTKEASEQSGYHSDYLARLCREGKIEGTQIGRMWFVSRDSLQVFAKDQKEKKRVFAEALAREREREYRTALQAASPKAPRSLSVNTLSGAFLSNKQFATSPFAAALATVVILGSGFSLAQAGVIAKTGVQAVAVLSSTHSGVIAFAENTGSVFAPRTTNSTRSIASVGSDGNSFGLVAEAITALSISPSKADARIALAPVPIPSTTPHAAVSIVGVTKALTDPYLLSRGYTGFGTGFVEGTFRLLGAYTNSVAKVGASLLALGAGTRDQSVLATNVGVNIGERLASAVVIGITGIPDTYRWSVNSYVAFVPELTEKTSSTQLALGSLLLSGAGSAGTVAGHAYALAIRPFSEASFSHLSSAPGNTNLASPLAALGTHFFDSFAGIGDAFTRTMLVFGTKKPSTVAVIPSDVAVPSTIPVAPSTPAVISPAPTETSSASTGRTGNVVVNNVYPTTNVSVVGVSKAYVDAELARLSYIFNRNLDNIPSLASRTSTSGSSATSETATNLSGGSVAATSITGSSLAITGNTTLGGTLAVTGNVTLGGTLTLSGVTGAAQCLHVDALGVISGTGADCGVGGSGLALLNGLTASTQTFATSTDTNITLTVTSTGSTHTFTPGWTGTLASGRGGTGISSVAANGLLIGNSSGTGFTQIATSTLGLTTTNVAEGVNVYYTLARVAAAIAGTTTDALSEGSTNQYYTNARARAAFSSTVTGLTYTSGTGVLSLTSGYGIPLTASSTQWNDFYTTPSGRITAGTNLSWSGNTLNGPSDGYVRGLISASSPLSYNSSTGALSIPQASSTVDGYLAAADFAAFNAKQAALSFTYPIQNSGNTISLAFGTTTANTWSQKQQFNGGASTTQLSVSGTAYFGSSATSTFDSAGNLSLAGLANTLLYANSLGVVSQASVSSPLTFASGSLSVGDAAADGTIKGIASFTANDFDATSGNVSIDYTNGQKASASQPGFLTSTDWNTFNGKFATTSTDYWLTTKSTSNLTEGTNLYYTPARVASVIAGTTTDALAEGSTNLYYTTGRVQTYLDSVSKGYFFGTTSASYFLSQNQGAAFSTTSVNYWLATKTTDNLTEGVTNKYYSDTLARGALSSSATGLTYTSGTGVFSLTSGYNIPLTASTTNWNTAYDSRISSATYPVQFSNNVVSLAFGTTSSNTWGGTQTFTNAPILGALSGIIYGTSGTLGSVSVSSPLSFSAGTLSIQVGNGSQNGYIASGDWTTFNNKISSTSLSASSPLSYNSSTGAFSLGTVGVVNGGTGSTTLGGILAGNGTSAVKTVVVGSGLTWDGTTLATNGSGITAIGPAGQTQTGGTQTLATSTAGSDFTITASSNTITFNLPTASTAVRGALAASDFTIFNNKISSTSLSASAPLSYNSSTGAFTITQASGSTNGYLSSTDWNTFNTKFATTSADFWKNANNFFSTTSADYWKTANNFYSTTSADYWLTTKSTSNLLEGSNLYYTAARVAGVIAGTTTDALAQGVTNRYYSDTLARSAISNSIAGITYTSGTGVLSLTSGYNIPLTASTTEWNSAYTNRITSATYPLQIASNVLSLAFGTTTANTWASTQTFTNPIVVGSGTGTSTFATNISIGGDIIPNLSNTYSLGTAAMPWKHVFVGPGSLYVNGQRVISTNGGDDVVISSDPNENLVFQTSGTANIELNPAGGQVQIKNTINVTAGKSITTTDLSALPVPSGVAAGNITVSGNAVTATNLNGGISLTPTGSGGTYVTAGNFGIGSTSPAQKLSVAGSALISNDLVVSGAATIGTATGLDYRSSGVISTATISAPLSFSAGTLAIAQATTGANGYLSSTDFTTFNNKISSTSLSAAGPLAYNSSTGAFTISQASVSTNGYLSSSDFTTFNNKISSTSLSSTVTGLTYASATGIFSLTAGYTIPLTASTTEWGTAYTNRITSATYPLQIASNVLSLAFGTTTANTWSALQTFANATATQLTTTGSTYLATAGGNVGVGTTSPYQTFSVAGSAVIKDNNAALNINNTNGSTLSYGTNSFNVGNGYIWANTSGTNRFQISPTGGVAFGSYAGVNDPGANNAIFSGNVGIGTTSPSVPLAVQGNGLITGNLYFGSAATATYSTITGNSAGTLVLTGKNNSQFTTTASTASLTLGTTNGPLLLSVSAGSTGYYALSVNGAERMRVANDGNVGIATTSPSQALSVQGNGLFSGSVTLGGLTATGTANINTLTLTNALTVANGGTGVTSYTIGDILYADTTTTLAKLPVGTAGQVLKVAAGLPSWGADQTIGSGGSDGIFATSSGKIYPLNTSDIVLVGTNSTSTSNSIFEVNGQAYVSSKIGVATTSPVTTLSVGGSGYFTGGLGVGTVNTVAGTLQTSGNATIGGSLNVTGLSGLVYGNGGTLTNVSVSAPLAFSAGTLSITQSSASADGFLSSTDWNAFNARLSTSSLALFDKGYFFSTTSADAYLTTKTTSNLLEGSNLYYTAARVAGVIAGTTTDALAQGATNRYYSDTLARAAFSSSATGLTYTSGTGVFSLTSGYNIPLTASTTEWGTAYTNRITSATYPLQIASNVLSLAFGTTTANSWSNLQQFNGNASTTQLTATGGAYLATVSGNVGIGTAAPNASYKLDIQGSGAIQQRIQSSDNQAAINLIGTFGQILNSTGDFYLTNNSASGNLIFRTNASAEQMRITSTGNVGIGTTTPASKLSVQGSALFSGDLSLANLIASGTATVGNIINNGVAANSLLYTNGSKQESAAIISAPLSFSAGTLAIAQATTGANGYLSSTDFTTFNNKISSTSLSAAGPLAYNSSTGAFTISQASVSTNGYLSSSDFAVFNNKISSTSLSSTATGLTYTSATGIFSLTAGYTIPLTASTTEWSTAYTSRIANATYPLQIASNVLSLAFGTTTTNTWSNLQTFTSGFLSLASSTIGNGTQKGGLTISGGATTTGNAYIGGNLSIVNSAIPTQGTINFGTSGANVSFDGSNYMVTGGAWQTSGASIVAQSNSNVFGFGVKYNAGTGAYYVGASNSATPDLIFTNTGASETARITNGGNFGLGTTSPYAKLSVVGQAVAEYFTATSTAATSTFPRLSVTNFSLGSDYLTDITGSGLFISGGALTVDTGLAFSTTSTNYWKTVNNFHSTTSADYWLTTKSTSSLTEGTNLYYTDARARAALSSSATGLTYTSGTGVFSLTAGYNIPLTASTTEWASAYLNRITSATYPLQISSNVLSLAFGTTTANTWSALQTFTSGFIANASSTVTGAFNVGGQAYFAGNVGIGSTSPTQALSVTGNLAFTNSNGVLSTSVSDWYLGTAHFASQFGVWVRSSGAGNRVRGLDQSGGTSANLGIFANGERMTIDQTNGNVGIGSTSPYAKLSVHAAAGSNNTTLFAIGSSTASATTTLFSVLNNGYVGIGTANPTSKFQVVHTGNAGGAFSFTDGLRTFSDASGVLGWNAASHMGGGSWNNIGDIEYQGLGDGSNRSSFYVRGAGTGPLFRLDNSSAVTQMTVTAGGLLGLGTSTPSQALSVQGSALLSGDLSLANLTATGTATVGTLKVTGVSANILPYINGSNNLAASTISAPLSFSAGTLAIAQATTGANGYLSSTDFTTFNNKISSTSLSASAPLAYNSSTGAFTISQSSVSTNGYLSSTDFAVFNNKISSTSLSSSATGLTYTSATGVFSLTAGYTIPLTASTTEWASAYTNRITSATYPLQISSNVLSLAFGTTTANTWSNLQTFTSGFISQASSTVSGAFNVGGTAYFAGNVGIGTTTPGKLLDVYGDGRFGTSLNTNITLGTSDAATGAWWRNDGSNSVISTNVGNMYYGLNGSTKDLYFMGGGNTAQLFIKGSTGSVGVGTTTPSSTLSVQGNGLFSGNLSLASLTATGTASITGTATVGNLISNGLTANSFIYSNGSKQLATGVVSAPLSFSAGTLSITQSNGSTNGYLSSTDWTAFNNKISSTSIDTSAELAALITNETGTGVLVFGTSPTFTTQITVPTITNAGTLALQATGANIFTVSTNGSERLRIDSAGDVGVGTTNPLNKLQVAGGATIGGTPVTGAGEASVSTSVLNAFSPTAALSSTVTTETAFRIARNGTNGDRFNLTADFNIGSYATGLNSMTQLDIRLGNGNANAPDMTVMSLLGNGNVGIGTTSPATKLSVQGNGLFSGNLSLASLTATGTASITGTATVGNLISSGLTANSFIYANGSKQLATGSVSAPLSFSAGTLAIAQATTGANGYLSSTDFTTFNNKISSTSLSAAGPLAYNSSTGAFTISQASVSTNGYLSSSDFAVFNNKISSTSLSSTATGLTYTSATGIFSLTAGYTIPLTASTTEWGTAYTNRITSATYPLQISSNVLSLAFGTTTTNTWSNLQTFTSGFISQASSTISDSLSVGGFGYFAGKVGIGSSSVLNTGLAVANTSTSTSGTYSGADVSGTTNAGSQLTGNLYGLFARANTAAGSANSVNGELVGVNAIANHSGQATQSGATAIRAQVAVGYGGTGSVGNTLTTATGIYIANPSIDTANSSSLGYTFGLYLDNQTAGTETNYTIYSAGGMNYFGGTVAVASSSASAPLSVTGNAGISGTLYAGHLKDLSIAGDSLVYANAASQLTGVTLGTGLTFSAGTLSVDGGSVYSTTSADYWLTTKSTSNLTEGSNLYYTDARARAALSSSATGLTYTSGTGVFSLTSGYSIPLTASTTEWGTAYTNRITSATYPLQIASNVLSLAFGTTTSNTWGGTQTFTNPITVNGTGTSTFAYGATFATTGGNVGIGTLTPLAALHVNGNILIPQNKALQGLYGGSVPMDLIGVDGNGDTNIYATGNNSSDIFFSTTVANISGVRMIITNAGNVGVGTTSPAQKLSVSGNGYVTGGLGVGVANTTAGTLQTSGNIVLGGSLTSGPYTLLGMSSNTLQIGGANVGSVEVMQTLYVDAPINVLPTTGRSTMRGSQSDTSGAGTGVLILGGIANTDRHIEFGIYSSTGSNWIQSWNNGSQAGNLSLQTSGGNIGIGTTSPSQALSVQGNGLFSGNLAVAGLTATGTISLPAASISNATLANSAITVSNGGGLTVSGSPVSLGGTLTLSLNTGNGNSWTGLQQFNGGASTTAFSAYNGAYFGATATSSFSSTGVLTLNNVSANSFIYANGSKQIVSGTVSAPLSFSAGTLSIAVATSAANGYLSSTDWSTFNGKLGSSTISSLTTNYLPKWNGSAFVNSQLAENGSNVGIGTTTSNWLLQVAGTRATFALSDSSAGTNLKHWLFTSAGGNLYIGTSTDGYATSTPAALTLTNNGNIGVGTTSPYAKLSVTGASAASYFNADSANATSTFAGGFSVGNGALQYDFSSGQTSIDNLALGALSFDADSGQISWIDMPVTAAQSAGTVQSYTAQLNGNPILTVYGQADGVGGVSNLGVGIATTSPSASLTVWAATSTPSTLANFVSFASTTIFQVNSNGTVGVGTTTPGSTFSVAGNALFSGTTTAANVISTGIAADSLIYTNGAQKLSAVTVGTATGLSFSAGTLSLSAIPNASLANSAITISNGGGLTVSGSPVSLGGTATVSLNTANANTWTALQTFSNATATQLTTTGRTYLGTMGGVIAVGTTSPQTSFQPTVQIDATTAGGSGFAVYNSTSASFLSNTRLMLSGTYAGTGGGYIENVSGNLNLNASSGSGVMTFLIGASEKARITSTGNLGIGTTTPATLLHLQGNATNEANLRFQPFANASFVGIENYTANGATIVSSFKTNASTGESRWFTGSSYFPTFYANGVEAARISTAGNFGIGTTTPSAALSIQGNSIFSGNLNVASLTATGTITFTGISSGLVKSTGGVLSAAVAGTDYSAALSFTYPLVNSANTISLAFGTTTANSWSALQQFNAGASTTQLTTTGSTYLATAGGAVAIGTTTQAVIGGHTGILALYGSNATAISLSDAVGRKDIRLNDGDLKFTNGGGTDQLVIANSGNVGIGTSSPSVLLTVGTQNTGTALDANEVFQFGGGTSVYGTVRNATDKLYLGLVPASGFIGTQTSFPFSLRTGGNDRLTITAAGNVGIGTTSPFAKLSVVGDAYLTSRLAVNGGVLTPGYALDVNGNVGINRNGSTGGSINFDNSGTGSSARIYAYDGSGNSNVFLQTNGVSYLNGGNVGIGSTTPYAKLSVKGAGSTTGVNFQTTNSSDAPLFTILDSGNVGIGLNSPQTPLDIKVATGTGLYNDSSLRIGDGSNTTAPRSLVLGISTTLPGLDTNGGSFIQSVYAGAGLYSPLHLQPQGGVTVFNSVATTSAVSVISNGDVLVRGASGSNTQLGRIGFNATNYGMYGKFPAYIAGYADNGVWSNGIGLTFNTISSGDVSGSNGVERLRITSAGNVGVGTTTPSSTFSVQGNGLFSGDLSFANLTATGTASIGTLSLTNALTVANGGTGSTTLGGILAGNGTSAVKTAVIGSGLSWDGTTLIATAGGSGTVGSGTTGQFPYYAANGTTVSATSTIFLATTGYVGVGTSTPDAKLTVSGGHVIVDNNYYYEGRTSAGVATNILGLNSSNVTNLIAGSAGFNLLASNQSTSRLFIDSSGNVGIGTTSPAYALDILGGIQTTEGLYFTKTGTGGYVWNKANAPIRFGTNNTERVRIDSSGNVGIGTTSPYLPLSVVGNGVFTGGTLNLGTSAGTGAGFNLIDSAKTLNFSLNSVGDFAINDQTTGTTRFYITASGKTGIGNYATGYMAPTNALDIQGGVTIGNPYSGVPGASNAVTAPTNGLIVVGSVGIGSSSPFAKLSIHANNGDTNTTLFAVGSSTASATSTLFRISNTGVATIGTAGTQAGSLVIGQGASVNGNITIGGTANQVLSGTQNALGTTWQLLTDTSGSGGPAELRFGSTGNLGFGSTAANIGTIDSNVSRVSAGVIGIGTGAQGSIAGTLLASTLGLGTTTPSQALSVQGNGLFSGNLSVANLTATGTATLSALATPAGSFLAVNASGQIIATTSPAGGGSGVTTATYPLLVSGNNMSLEFGTTTANSWSALQTFANATATQLTVTGNAYFPGSGIWNSLGNVGVGTVAPSANFTVQNNYGSTNSTLFLISSSTAADGSSAASLFSVDSTGVTTIGNSSGTGDANFQFASDANAWSIGYSSSDKSFRIASSTNLNSLVALSISKNGYLGLGTTTPGSILSVAGVANFGTATSTFYSTGGINLAAGCFAVNGVCVGSGGIGSGTTGQFPYYAANGTTLSATSSLFLATSGNVGLGTVSPSYKLDVAGHINIDQFSTYKQNGNTILYASSTTGSLSVGTSAGMMATTSSATTYLTAVGHAAAKLTTGAYNTAVGYAALATNTSGTENTAIGYYALYSNNSGGTYNTAVGSAAGQNITSGDHNTAIGWQALTTYSSGNYTTVVGSQALQNTTGSNNTALGYQAGYNLTTGTDNTLVGYGAGSNQGYGSFNTGIGRSALRSTVGHLNLALGNQAGYDLTSGQQNILLGSNNTVGGNNITTGSNNISIGFNSMFPSSTANNQLNFANTIFGTITATSTSTSVPTNFSGTLIGIASTSPWARLSVDTGNLGTAPAFAIGSSTGTRLIVTNAGLVGIGTTTPSQVLSVQGSALISGNLSVAGITATSTVSALSFDASQYGGYKQNGSTILYASTTNQSVAVGASAAATWMSASSTAWYATAIGFGALGTTPTSGAATYNTATGYNALAANTRGALNTANGANALYVNTTGSYNTAIGQSALVSNTTGSENTVLGESSLLFNQTGSSNVAIGAYAGQGGNYSSNTGSTYVGYSAGTSVLTGASYNTLLGYKSGYGITSGARNTVLGNSTIAASYNQITTGSNNIAIGNDVAVASATASNQLVIGNLIYGTTLSGTGATVSTGNIGIASTTPWARLSIEASNLGSAPAFAIGSSSITSFIVTSAGKVGIGTTSPNSKLEILEANSVPQFRLSNGSGYTDFTVDSTGDLKFTTNGGDIRALSENLWVCDNAGCPALTATSTSGNIFVENSTTFGNGFSLKNLSSTELGLYDHAGSQVLIFDEGI